MAKKNSQSNSQPEVKRGPGRPPAMPGQTMKNHMVRVATDVPGLIGELAAARGQSLGTVVTNLVREAAARRAASQKAAATRRGKAASV